MRKKRVNFTNDEDLFIIENQDKLPCSDIGKKLGRSVNSIENRRKILFEQGKISQVKTWVKKVSQEEIDFIKANLTVLGVRGCCQKLNRPYATVYQIIKKNNWDIGPTFRLCNTQDISHFAQYKDGFVVYFLGLMWADGNISKVRYRLKLKIKKSDFDNIQHHIHRLGDFWNKHEYQDNRNPHWSIMTVLETTHRELWAFFKDHDYLIKSGASADKILSCIPEHLRHYWWRGYFDGDGCFSSRKLCFNSGLNQDWTFVENLGKLLDISFSVERKDRGKRGGSKAGVSRWHFIKKVIDYMYQGESFGLKRKKDRCFQYLTKYKEPRKRGGTTSKYRGVSWSNHTRNYVMQITHGSQKIHQRFDDETLAAQTYDMLAKQFFGNKAILNFS